MIRRTVFVAGGTGYIGRHIIPALIGRGHRVLALARSGSESKVPPGVSVVLGDALNSQTYASRIPPADTFIHLIGVSSPSPAKKELFRTIDQASLTEALRASAAEGIGHFVYVSVAQPAPIMKAYVRARAECEAMIKESRLNATVLRPWYVLGPGHRWPTVLIPAYWLLERIPATREAARRLGVISLSQMVTALTWSVENPADGMRMVDVRMMKGLE